MSDKWFSLRVKASLHKQNNNSNIVWKFLPVPESCQCLIFITVEEYLSALAVLCASSGICFHHQGAESQNLTFSSFGKKIYTLEAKQVRDASKDDNKWKINISGQLERLQVHKWNLHCNCQFLNSIYLTSLVSSLCCCASSTPASSSKLNHLPGYQFQLQTWTGCTIAAHNNICVAGECCFPSEHPPSICFFSYQTPSMQELSKESRKDKRK